MNILITGIAGFVGSNLSKQLCLLGYNIYGVDNLSTGKLDNLKECKIKQFFQLDLTNKHDIEIIGNIIKDYNIDTVFHLAAQASILIGNDTPEKTTEINYFATINLLNKIKNTTVRKFVFTSSMTVYGDQKPPFYAGQHCEPASSYAISKYAAERHTIEFCKRNNISYTIFRPFNIYGPKQDLNNPYQGVAAIFIGKALKNEDIFIYGDGKKTRDFIYIDDVCKYLIKSIRDFSGRILNLGTGIETSIDSLAKNIISISESKSSIIYKEPREFEQLSSRAYLSQDFQRFLFINLTQGLTKTIQWNKKNLKS